MKTQKTLPFVGPFPPVVSARTQERLDEAHLMVEAFREDKRRHLAAIKRMLEQEPRLTTADQIKEPKP